MGKSQKALVAAGEAAGASVSSRSRNAARGASVSSAKLPRSRNAGRAEAGGPAIPLRIGEVAGRAGVGIDALRFYEREGLIPTPPRDASSGYRVYPADVVRTVRFIREAQALGFTLRETAELLRLSNDKTTACSDVRRAADAKLADIERRIRQLQGMRSALRSLVETCGDGSERACPILEALLDGPASSPTRAPRSATRQRRGARS